MSASAQSAVLGGVPVVERAQASRQRVRSSRRAACVRAAGHNSAAARAAAAAASPTLLVKPTGAQVMHSLTAERLEVVRDLDHFAATELVDLLKPVEKCWQCQDFMPDPSSPTFLDEVRELQKRSANIPDDHILVLVGDMITEEALPTYMTMLNTLDGTRDETGASDTAWATWTRKWTAEENRHGDAMNKYLWLTGRVNMRAVEITIQNLIGSGMDPKTENNPYLGFVYTSFQERATKVAHGNTARFAKDHGDDVLAKMCGLIAADEGRHEIAYQRIMDELFKRDPDGAVLAFADMMKKQIVMPAHLMDDGEHRTRTSRDLFSDYSAVAERVEAYTAFDYCDIMQHLIERWQIDKQSVRSGEAAEAQEFLMKQPERIRKLAAFAKKKKVAATAKTGVVHENFSWIFGRKVEL